MAVADLVKSTGHVAFLHGSIRSVELYLDGCGELYVAPIANCIDCGTGYRHGRWEAPAWMAERSITQLREDYAS